MATCNRFQRVKLLISSKQISTVVRSHPAVLNIRDWSLNTDYTRFMYLYREMAL